MSETNELLIPEQTLDLSTTADDADDVEGHGLREVAAGLGAAAVLAGGAGAAMAATSSSLPAVHPSTPGISVTNPSIPDPITLIDQETDKAIATAREARNSAIGTAGALASQAGTTASTTYTTARDAGDTAVGIATDAATALGEYANENVEAATTIAANVKQYAENTAAGAASTVRETGAQTIEDLGAATSEALATADRAATDASRTAATVVRESDRKIATVLSVATTTANDGITQVTATLKAVNAGAGVDVEKASGWMTVRAGDTVVAQWQVTGSSTTASFTAPVVGSQSVTVTYTGDDTFASSLRTVAL